MALATEALGMMLPGSAAVPAVLAERRRIAEQTGARAIALRDRTADAGQDRDAAFDHQRAKNNSRGRRLDQRP